MTNTLRIRGEVPFPAAGEGVALRFTNPDCDALQKKYGDHWFTDAMARCNRFDLEFIRDCVLIGTKKDGKKHVVDWDKLDCTIFEASEAVLDALFLAVHGRNFNDYLEYLNSKRNLEAAKEDEGNSSSPENT